MFLTAASSNHFKSAKQFIQSLKGAPLIFYDIGLTESEANEIKSMPLEYRLFDWSLAPKWGHLSATFSGSYVWKPIIIHTVYQEDHDILIWCDSGNIIYDKHGLENHVNNVGIYTPISSGNIRRWTHDTCLSGMSITPQQYNLTMRNAAIIGFKRSMFVDQFINEWKTCSLKEELIIGPRDTHRWDQSILTCLFYKYNRSCSDGYIGLSIHNDCD